MPAAALCWLSLPQMGEMGWTQFPGPALTIFRGKLGLRAMSCWSLGSQLRLGLGPGLAGGPSVRAKEPAVPARAEEAGAAGGRGARGPPWRSQAASRPLIRNSFSMNSGVPASLPRPTHRFLPGPPPAGWEARPGLPGPQAHSQTSRGGSRPSCPPLTPHGQSRKGALRGVLAGCGTAPLPHQPGLGWCGLPASSCSCPPRAGRGTGQEGKARRAWTGQSRTPSSSRKGHRETFSSWDVGAHLGWGTWAIGFPSPVLSFLLCKMGGKYVLPAGEMNEMSSPRPEGPAHCSA